MKVLVDYIGHADLYYSIHKLFEERLGAQIYRPVGPGWDQKGVITSTLPDVAGAPVEVDGLYCIPMPTHNYTQKCITFEQFLEMDFDILLTTSWMNETPFYNLIQQHKPNAALVRQIANIHEKPSVCKNVLLSTCEPMAADVNWIRYYPEHLDKYCPGPPPTEGKTIKSFYNYMQNFAAEVQMWREFESALPEFVFKMHGGGGEHGSVPQEELEKVMQQSTFIWHVKPHGGCGYTARQALACGKPLIVRKDYCGRHRTLASEYMVDGVNCIDISPSARSLAQSAALIREWSQPGIYAERCAIALQETSKYLKFEEEANSIKVWLERL